MIATLSNPREKFWGMILALAPEGLSLSGAELASFEDLAVMVRDGEPFTPAVVFFPMHRIERVELDLPDGSLPSLSQRFFAKTGLEPSAALAPRADKKRDDPRRIAVVEGARVKLSQIFTAPNQLTLLRMVFVPFIVIHLVEGRYLWALVVFVIAGFSDGLDGLLARRLHQQTLLGQYLDPIADKLLLSTIFLVLSILHKIPWKFTVVVFSRDISILAASAVLFAIAGLRDFRPSIFGKANTFSQIAAVFFVFFAGSPLRWIWIARTVFLRATFFLHDISALALCFSGATASCAAHAHALPRRGSRALTHLTGFSRHPRIYRFVSGALNYYGASPLQHHVVASRGFRPLRDKEVRMYACGPTVYDYGHIGNFRTFVAVDILQVFRQSGYNVRHVMNITDVDDKIIRNSARDGVSVQQYTAKYEKAFLEDTAMIGIEEPKLVRATEHIAEMADFVAN